jgi:tRNA dimethylallyltransferase
VCGPTASGKSALADELADSLTQEHDSFVPTLVIDSMQVYREIPEITNQRRRRLAELVGFVSVTEEWTVARHKECAEEKISKTHTPFVLDAGTGMYLNAIILDLPLAPQVDATTRHLAQSLTSGATNPRRAARQKELELAGAPPRRSIWDGETRYDTALIYLRPDKHSLDAAIYRRSERIVKKGLEEAQNLTQFRNADISATVLDSIGVRELLEFLSGTGTAEEAIYRIATRTRQLARRQRRWFDKLARTVAGRVPTTVVTDADDINTMHDRIWAWVR